MTFNFVFFLSHCVWLVITNERVQFGIKKSFHRNDTYDFGYNLPTHTHNNMKSCKISNKETMPILNFQWNDRDKEIFKDNEKIPEEIG